jgi:uncharacterized protein
LSKLVDYIATKTGRAFSLVDPRQEQVSAEDIAHALAFVSRFGGHTEVFYSVAEHCLHVADLLKTRGADTRTQLYGLLHDAAEFAVGDNVTQVKGLVPGLRDLEKRILAVIYRKFGLDPDGEPPEVKEADMDMLVVEAQDLFTPDTYWTWFAYLGRARPADAPFIGGGLGYKQPWLTRLHDLLLEFNETKPAGVSDE